MPTAAVMGFRLMFSHGLPEGARTAIIRSHEPLGKAVGEGAARLHHAISGRILPLARHRAHISRVYNLAWTLRVDL